MDIFKARLVQLVRKSIFLTNYDQLPRLLFEVILRFINFVRMVSDIGNLSLLVTGVEFSLRQSVSTDRAIRQPGPTTDYGLSAPTLNKFLARAITYLAKYPLFSLFSSLVETAVANRLSNSHYYTSLP